MTKTAEEYGGVQSIDRALMLLEILGASDRGARLVDLAGETGLAASTIHRLLTALERRDFIRVDPRDRRWYVGRRTFSVGSAFLRQRNLAAAALPLLRRLRDETRETVNIGVVEGATLTLVDQVASREIPCAIAAVGAQVPLASSAMGKTVLASYAPDEISAVLSHAPLRHLTRHSPASRDALEARLVAVRRDGYAVDDEEVTVGLRCVAAAVRGGGDEPICAISVSGLSSRVTRDRVPDLGHRLLEASNALARRLRA